MKILKYIYLPLFTFLFAAASWANVVTVSSASAKVYSSANLNAKVATQVTQGQRLQATGQQQNGFTALTTKSGRPLWILTSDLEMVSDASTDLVAAPPEVAEAPKAPRKTPRRQQLLKSEPEFDRLTYDLGLSVGSVGDSSYTEINLGLNYFFKHWLAWRNALFGRLLKENNDFGLDTSLRAIGRFDLDRGSGVTFFGGPGYRFADKAPKAPFLEGGLVIRFVGFSIGGGAKTIFNKFADKDYVNDTQYFIILSGSGSL